MDLIIFVFFYVLVNNVKIKRGVLRIIDPKKESTANSDLNTEMINIPIPQSQRGGTF